MVTPKKIRVASLYGAGVGGELMHPRYSARAEVQELIQRRHLRGTRLIDKDGYYVSLNGNGPDHRWHVPYGVRAALKERLLWVQVVNKYPFYATWVSPKTGKRLRKKFMSLPGAIHFITTQAQYVDPDASIIARHGFTIPIPLMGKFPRRAPSGHILYWCPRCMDQRRYRRTDEYFYGRRKFPEYNRRGEQVGYEWRDVKLSLMECRVCGSSNREDRFRISNQPLEKRRIKPGVRRVKRRR